MPTPKKKLPTGPIRIEPPLSKPAEVSTLQAAEVQTNLLSQESTKPEGEKQDSTKPDSTKPETSSILNNSELLHQESTKPECEKQDSTNPDSTKLEISSRTDDDNKVLENAKQDSGSHESCIIESSALDSLKKESALLEPNFADDNGSDSAFISPNAATVITEYSLQDSGLLESGSTETEYKKVAMRLSALAVEKLQNFRAATGIPYEILVDVMIHNWEDLPERTRSNYLQQAKLLRISRLMAGQEKTMKTMKAKYFPS